MTIAPRDLQEALRTRRQGDQRLIAIPSTVQPFHAGKTHPSEEGNCAVTKVVEDIVGTK